MGIQPGSLPNKTPQVPPAMPEAEDNDFKKQCFDPDKKVSTVIPGAQKESDSDPDEDGKDYD